LAAEQIFLESKDARIEFMKEAKRCRNLITENSKPEN